MVSSATLVDIQEQRHVIQSMTPQIQEHPILPKEPNTGPVKLRSNAIDATLPPPPQVIIRKDSAEKFYLRKKLGHVRDFIGALSRISPLLLLRGIDITTGCRGSEHSEPRRIFAPEGIRILTCIRGLRP